MLELKEKTAYEQLIEDIEAGNFSLSFSSLKAFAKSPKHFIEYKLKERATTKAMRKGTLSHCLILEPEEFDERYEIRDIDQPDKSGNAGRFCEMVLNGVEPLEAYKANYKTERLKPETLTKKLDDIKAKYDYYFKWKKGLLEKEPVGRAFFEEIQKTCQKARKNKVLKWGLENTVQFEKYIDLELFGFKWKGYIDMVLEAYNADLKFVADASPQRFERVILKDRYHWQGAIYAHGTNKEHIIYGIEKDGSVGSYLIERKKLEYAMEEIETYVKYFKKCMAWGKWNRSYDFWADRKTGFFTI